MKFGEHKIFFDYIWELQTNSIVIVRKSFVFRIHNNGGNGLTNNCKNSKYNLYIKYATLLTYIFYVDDKHIMTQLSYVEEMLR